VAGISEKVDVEVIWAGGHRTRAQITHPVACLTQLSYYPQLAARARELAGSGCTTAAKPKSSWTKPPLAETSTRELSGAPNWPSCTRPRPTSRQPP
jgi:hypothetical protein